MAQFKKGQSGNPAGRPKGIKDKRTKFKEAAELISLGKDVALYYTKIISLGRKVALYYEEVISLGKKLEKRQKFWANNWWLFVIPLATVLVLEIFKTFFKINV